MGTTRRVANVLLGFCSAGLLLLLLVTLAACGSSSGGGASPAASETPAGSPSSAAQTGASPTAAELQAFVKEAIAYVDQNGKDAALKEFSDPNGSFRRGELYIFATDFNGICLAQGADPSKVGQDLSGMEDPNGVKIVQKQIALARTGGGWMTYDFANPASGDAVEPKLAYFLKAGADWYVGSGTYGPAATEVPTRDEVKAVVDKAYDYATANGKDAAVNAFMDPAGDFWVGQLYVFANDSKGVVVCYPPDPSWIGTDRWNVKDAAGEYYVRDLVDTAMTSGSGWVKYQYVDPVSGGAPQTKISYVRKVDDTWYVGAGTYVAGE